MKKYFLMQVQVGQRLPKERGTALKEFLTEIFSHDDALNMLGMTQILAVWFIANRLNGLNGTLYWGAKLLHFKWPSYV